jgi:hypothetical protein
MFGAICQQKPSPLSRTNTQATLSALIIAAAPGFHRATRTSVRPSPRLAMLRRQFSLLDIRLPRQGSRNYSRPRQPEATRFAAVDPGIGQHGEDGCQDVVFAVQWKLRDVRLNVSGT